MNGSAVRAVIWDLDGTLADTLRDLAESANAALALHGLPQHGEDEYRLMVGNGVRALLCRAAGGNYPETDALMADYFRIYHENCLKWVRAYPGITDAVHQLQDAGIRQAVVTNKPQEPTDMIVSALFPGIFGVVYGQCGGRSVKPDPALTLRALSALGVCPGNAVFIGDSDVDIFTAKAAGMRNIGACWGFRGRQELESAGADVLAVCAKDITERLTHHSYNAQKE